MRYNDLSKRIFGRLTPLKKIGTKHDCALWLCQCRCGNLTERSSGELTRTKKSCTSCGFCQDHLKHPKEWLAWRNMKSRCQNKESSDYKNYGAKGIDVCVFWRDDFLNFLDHIGKAPTPDHTVDRIDSTKWYEPGNVRWATRQVQNLNKCNVHTSLAKLKLRLLLAK